MEIARVVRTALLVSLVVPSTALAQEPVAPPSGLAGWWSMDGSAKDIGPSGLDGALAGAGGTFVAGQVDEAFRPSQLDGHVSVSDDPSLRVSTDFTFEFWIRQDALASDRVYLVNKGSADHLRTPYTFGIVGANSVLRRTVGSSQTGWTAPGRPFVVVSDGMLEQVLVASTAVPTGPLTHLAFSVQPVSSGFQARIYMNGSLIGYTWLSRLPFTGTDSLKLGGISGMQSLDGAIDEVSLYGRALTLAEIQAIFNAGPAGKDKPVSDTTPPLVAITLPADGAILASRSVAVSVDVADQSATEVVSSPAGLTASLPAGGGTAEGIIYLDVPDGPALISITATDEAGNSAANSVTVVLDTTPAAVTVLNPNEGAVFGSSPVSFAVEVNDSTATTLQVDAVTRSLPAGHNAVTVEVPLVEGDNPVVVAVTDSAGNRTEIVRSVVLDLSVPSVAILSPPDGALFGAGQSAAPVSARIDDLTATDVSSVPGGVSGSLPPGGGLLSGAVTLQEGINLITVTATDEAGRVGEASVAVNLDTTGPVLSFSSPPAGVAVNGVVEVVASAADVAPGSGVARIDLFAGTALLASATGDELRFDLDTTNLPDGDHTLRAVAVDGAANESAALLPLTVDNTAPAVQILSPLTGMVRMLVPFTALASDTGTGLVSVVQLAGGQAPDIDGSATFDPPVPSYQADGLVDTRQFANGPLVLEVVATDLAGNSTSIQVLVDVQNDLPDPPGLKPRDGTQVRGTVTLKVAADRTDLEELELLVDGQSVGRAARSPLVVRFDTTSRMDGPMQVTGVVCTSSGSSETVHTLHVDNMRLRALQPGHLSLSTIQGAPPRVQALLTGPNLHLLLPVERHRIELRIPGCSPVALQSAGVPGSHPRGRGSHPGMMTLWFEREALVAVLRAARATGAMREEVVQVSLFADGVELGRARLAVRGGGERGRRR